MIYFGTFFLFLLACGVQIVYPEQSMINYPLWAVFSLFLITILVRDGRKIFKNKSSKVFGESSITVILLLFILIFLNLFIFNRGLEYKASVQRVNSLSGQSEAILTTLAHKKIKFTLFSNAGKRKDFDRLINLYIKKSPEIELNVYDPVDRPMLTQKYGIDKYDSLVIEMDSKNSIVENIDELSITNALIKLSKKNNKQLLYTTGHDELDLEQTNPSGGSSLKQAIENDGHSIREINLAKENIARGTQVLLIISPKKSFLKDEIRKIEDFIQAGGNIFFSFGPYFKSDNLKKIKSLFSRQGFVFHNDVLVNSKATQKGVDPSIYIKESFSSLHPLMKGFNQRMIFPLSTTLSYKETQSIGQKVFKFTPLINSDQFPASWGEVNLSSFAKGKVSFSKKDKKGPLSIAFAAEEVRSDDKERSRFVLIGNSRFLINGYSGNSGNLTMFLNSLSWLNYDEQLITLSRPEVKKSQLRMDAKQIKMIFFLTVVFLPLLLIGFAILQYRRNRIIL